MQQIRDWLKKLGLGQYAQRFAENDITFVILPDLTDQDLEKIGVASLGHRRLLLRAISELDSVGKATANQQVCLWRATDFLSFQGATSGVGGDAAQQIERHLKGLVVLLVGRDVGL